VSERQSSGGGAGSRPASAVAPHAPAWYHVDFCHAYAWVYEDGDRLLVKWGERDQGINLHRKMDCDRCTALARREFKPRYGEFHMDKPSAEFSSTEAFCTVLVELGKWVPGLTDEGDE